jgi:hypothetical protein
MYLPNPVKKRWSSRRVMGWLFPNLSMCFLSR